MSILGSTIFRLRATTTATEKRTFLWEILRKKEREREREHGRDRGEQESAIHEANRLRQKENAAPSTEEARIYPLAVFEGCRYISRLDTYREQTGEDEKGKPRLVG